MAEQNKKIMQSEKKVLITCILVSCIFAAKLAGAYLTNSLALFSDSWHLLTDIASLVISWWGLRQARKLANTKYTFGYFRHGILTALINNVSLILISVFIFYKAVERFLHPAEIEPRGMIFLAVFGLTINCVIVFTLKGNTGNANVKSVFLHFLGDALSDCGVLLGGVLIWITGINGIDTVLSAGLACLILGNALKMARECVKILLEGAPAKIPIYELKRVIRSVDGVVSVTDLHVWSLSMETNVMTAHVCFTNPEVEDCEDILHSIQHRIRDRYGIEHSTIQFEHCTCSSCYHSKADHRTNCALCIDSAAKDPKNEQ